MHNAIRSDANSHFAIDYYFNLQPKTMPRESCWQVLKVAVELRKHSASKLQWKLASAEYSKRATDGQPSRLLGYSALEAAGGNAGEIGYETQL